MRAVVGNLVNTSLVVVETTAFALKALVEEPKEHLPAEITKSRRLVRVNEK